MAPSADTCCCHPFFACYLTVAKNPGEYIKILEENFNMAYELGYIIPP